MFQQSPSRSCVILIALVLFVVSPKNIAHRQISSAAAASTYANPRFSEGGGAGRRLLNVTQDAGERCNRPCVNGQQRVCYFKFTLEHYQVMGVACGACNRGVEADCFNPQCILGDGFEKGVMSINRQVPGPGIHVCHGDLVVVDVVNQAQGTAAAIHWHGLHMVDTPFMDGVPFVTQCPIDYTDTFRYHFWATEQGTHFYHSHSGHHKVNGQYGAIVVRADPKDTRNAEAYDFDLPEHHILISDWMHPYAEQYYPGLPSSLGIFPDSVLINGRGVYYSLNGTRHEPIVPPTRFYVTPGKRYRFRLINSISHSCPFQLQVEKHPLTLIASDSYDLQPTVFNTLVSNSGERYDFVLTANQSTGSADYWIRVRGLGVCATIPTEAFALVRYVGNEAHIEDNERPLPRMPDYNETYAPGILVNDPNATCSHGDSDFCITELEGFDKDEELRNGIPEYRFFLAFHNFPVPNEEIFKTDNYYHFANLQSNLTIVGAINNLSLVFPNYPLLTQSEEMDESQFCNEFEWPQKCVGNRLCPCVHRLHIRWGAIVELIIVDESESVGRLHHPFHLHGHRFMVTDLGHNPDASTPLTVAIAKQLDKEQKLQKNYPQATQVAIPAFKDTISIPSRGYAIVRLRAENPGFWLMHCHYEWHLAIGMGLILQVGDISEMVAPPKAFPRCGDYKPEKF